jgi:hypothetical protein
MQNILDWGICLPCRIFWIEALTFHTDEFGLRRPSTRIEALVFHAEYFGQALTIHAEDTDFETSQI